MLKLRAITRTKVILKYIYLLAFTVLIALMAFFIVPQTAFANQAVIKGNIVNLRAGPGTENQIVGTAMKGETIQVLGRQGDWLKASKGGTVCWVAGWLVDYKDPAAGDLPSGSDLVIINANQVNIRSGPGATYPVLAMYDKGSRFKMLGQSSGWYKIELDNGQTGWVAGWLAVLQKEQATSGNPSGTSTIAAKPAYGGIVVPEHYNNINLNPSNPVTLKSVTAKAEVEDTVVTVTVDEGFIEYDIGSLNNPDRLYIDIKGYAPGQVPQLIPAKSDLVNDLRVGWYAKDPDLTRIVLDLEKRVKYEKSLSDDGKTLTLVIKPQFRKSPSGSTVILDPGHGGSDPGAIGPSGIKEKDVNLAIALKTAEILEAQGVNVILTRTGDTFVELVDRPNAAGPKPVDVFVSIHSNANNLSSVNGTSVYYLRENAPGFDQDRLQSMYLAQRIQAALVDTIKRQDRGILQANFLVLVRSEAPAALVETAFISNPEEEKLLADRDFQEKAAEAISRGIINYLTGK